MKYFDVKIPDEYKEFFERIDAVVKRDEDEMYSIFPATFSDGNDVLPVCVNGTYYVNRQESISQLATAASAAYNVADLLIAQHHFNGCI